VEFLSSSKPLGLRRTSMFLLQVSPFLGGLIGCLFALFLWLLGAISDGLNWGTLDWMWKDPTLMQGAIALGFSMGMLMRINQFFPDIKGRTVQADPQLSHWLSDPKLLPADSQPVHLQGKLIGRKGLGNLLSQDLMLQTATGVIKLHFFSPLGPIGNIFPETARPYEFINTPVVVTGWLRRGATPWMDVNLIRTQQGKFLKSSHPLWATFLAFVTAVWGAYVIFRGPV
jgi:hypothetical protein